jgi:hypothetical protein
MNQHTDDGAERPVVHSVNKKKRKMVDSESNNNNNDTVSAETNDQKRVKFSQKLESSSPQKEKSKSSDASKQLNPALKKSSKTKSSEATSNEDDGSEENRTRQKKSNKQLKKQKQKRKEMKKKKKEVKRKKQEESGVTPIQKHRDFSTDLTEYLQSWEESQAASSSSEKSWKFNKVLQEWSLQHCLEKQMISSELFKKLTPYLLTVQGKAKERLTESLQKAAEESEVPANNNNENDENEALFKSIAKKRAIRLLVLLEGK